jgi:hypothetical protein
METNTQTPAAPPIRSTGWFCRVRAWMRNKATNGLDREWDELSMMSDAALCDEYSRLLAAKGETDRFRRCNMMAGMRWWVQMRKGQNSKVSDSRE